MILNTPADPAFTSLQYALGCGWATVVQTGESRSYDARCQGATTLEIRYGRIARETLYYTSTDVPFTL